MDKFFGTLVDAKNNGKNDFHIVKILRQQENS